MNLPFLKKLNIGAITVWKWVIYAEKDPSMVLVNHERIHLEQIKRDGVLKFYSKYLFDYLKLRLDGLNHRDAYLRIPYEREAYNNQRNLDYKVENE